MLYWKLKLFHSYLFDYDVVIALKPLYGSGNERTGESGSRGKGAALYKQLQRCRRGTSTLAGDPFARLIVTSFTPEPYC